MHNEINKAKDEEYRNRLLYPGKYLHEIDTNNLQIDVLPSGFAQLDDYMLLKRGRSELIIVGGRPSSGKSSIMFQIALQISLHTPVHVFSLEMDEEQVVTRLLSVMLDVPMNAIQKGFISRDRLVKAKEDLKKYKYIIDDRGGLSIQQLMDAARVRHKKDGIGCIVIDYLQLLRIEKGHSKDDEIGTITRALKELAKELRVPIIVGSQLNRNNEIRGAGSKEKNFRPQLADLRESGNIEQDADIVLLIHRESRYTGLRQGEADIIVAKNRNGPIGTAVMLYHAAQARFEDVTREEI